MVYSLGVKRENTTDPGDPTGIGTARLHSDELSPPLPLYCRLSSRRGAMQKVHTLINARWIIPVEPQGYLEHHSLVIDHGTILDILPTAAAIPRYQADETVDLPTHALIPGLINAHTHAAMCLFRGLADDLPLMDWLQHHIWPAEEIGRAHV